MRERYKEGSARSAKNILSVIEETKAADELILVFLHKSVDGDCVGAASGVVSMIRAMGGHAYVAIPECLPENMKFLGIEELFFQPDSDTEMADEFRNNKTIGGRKVGAVIATDLSEGSRMGVCGPIFDSIDKKIVIDHHASVTARSDNMWIDPDASSACEMVFYVAQRISVITGKDMREILYPNAAKAVLAGIVTDTGRFTFKNTRPETLETAGHLIDLGGDISEVCYNLLTARQRLSSCCLQRQDPKCSSSATASSRLPLYRIRSSKNSAQVPTEWMMLYQPCATSTALNSRSY